MTSRRTADRAKVSADNYFAMVPEWVLYAPVSATAIRLYAVLARIANDASSEGFAKRQTLAERLAGKDGEPVSVKTVDRATAELEQLGAIEVIPQFDACGDRRENLYRVITRRPEVATPESLGGDTSVPTPGHQCPDGGDTSVPTVATPVSLQRNQSPLTRALEPEIFTYAREPLTSSSPTNDDDSEAILNQTWLLLAQGSLDRRNVEYAHRGGDRIPTGPRSDGWLHAAAAREQAIFEQRARNYLADDPTLTAERLAELLDPDLDQQLVAGAQS